MISHGDMTVPFFERDECPPLKFLAMPGGCFDRQIHCTQPDKYAKKTATRLLKFSLNINLV